MTDLADWLFARGHAVDIVLAVLLGELILLTGLGGWPLRTALWRLLPGALMLIALRAALTGADWHWIAATLTLSFPAHIADLRGGRPPPRREGALEGQFAER